MLARVIRSELDWIYAYAAGRLLAHGSISDGAARASDPRGLIALNPRGAEAWQLFPHERAYLAQTAARYGYVLRKRGEQHLVSVVDLRTGRLLRTLRRFWRIPVLLSSEGGGWLH